MSDFADCYKATMASNAILKVSNSPLSYISFDAINSLGRGNKIVMVLILAKSL
tara:strand:- start:892 stop:1050 length:159 start_codon:yes stop_codon:yes gene_type:complete